MAKYLKLFEEHSDYEDFIESEDFILPNVSLCEDQPDVVHFNPICTVTLTVNLSQAGKERISHVGDMSVLGGPQNDDGLSNVSSILIDGVAIDIENDLTTEVVFNAMGTVNGYMYNFTTTGEHTITYFLKTPTVMPFMFTMIGNIDDYFGFSFPSNFTSMVIHFNGISLIENRACTVCGTTGLDFGRTQISIYQNAFSDCDNITSLFIPKNTHINPWAFRGCMITSAEFEYGTTEINGLSGLFQLTGVTIPNSVIKIGAFSLEGCTSLSNITIPNSVTVIESCAFSGCTSLSSIIIPAGVTSIENDAFNGCSSLSSVTILATTPPALVDKYVFSNNAANRKFYVPSGSVDAYKAATGWSSYASYIEAIPS